MGRQKMPEMEATTGASVTPMFGSEREAAESDAPVKVIQEGGPASAQPEPTPGYVPPPSVLRAHADAKRKLEELEAMMRAPQVIPVPKRYRAVGIPIGGLDYMGQDGKMHRLRPGKLLDERYFPIQFLRDQGFELIEVEPGARQIGRVVGQPGRTLG
jgi:hypothetical protein